MLKACILAIAAGVLLTACATVPTGPSVMVLPGNGKDFEHFQVDDAVCRQWAAQQTGTTPTQVSTESTVSGAAIGTLLGAAVGAAVGAASGNPATGAAVGAGVGLLGGTAVGAGVGLLGGTAVGAGNAETAHRSVQHRYDSAYMQCMYAKGNQIPMARGSVPTYTWQPPAANAPANVPPPPPGPPPPPPPGPSR